MNKYQPLFDRVLVRPEAKKDLETTDGGIYIPDTAKKLVSKGYVVSVGPGRYASETGTFIPTVLGKNDYILYGSEQGMPITVEGEELLMMNENEVLMVLPKKDAE